MAYSLRSRARNLFRNRSAQPVSRFIKLRCEQLEDRSLPSAVSLLAHPNIAAGPLREIGPRYLTYTPTQIVNAYGFSNLSLSGSGQTIAIVDAYDDPNIVADLQSFDRAFSTPSLNLSTFASYSSQTAGQPYFYKTSPTGTTPAADAGWATEVSLDVEWAHAIAPLANILLVEAASNANSDLLSAVSYAASQPGVSVVSMSWGESEFAGEMQYDSTFNRPGVTFVASTGDSGASGGPEWPAVSPNVLAVGGTQLNLSGNTYVGETAWNGSGGGTSAFEAKPSYQDGVNTTTARTIPDVAYNASGSTTYAVYDSYKSPGLESVYGTSAGAPQWAGLVALANQGRGASGPLTNAQAAVYGLSSSSFHDITSGSNGRYSAKVGYDEVTGLGSPRADLVVPGLVAAAGSSQNYSAPKPAASSGSPSSTNTHRFQMHGTGTAVDITGVAAAQPSTVTSVPLQLVVAASSTGTNSIAVVQQLSRDGRVNFDPVSIYMGEEMGDVAPAAVNPNPMVPMDQGQGQDQGSDDD